MDRISLVMNFIAIVIQCFVINEFGMNSFVMFINFMNLYDSFMNSYGYNHKNNLITLKNNFCGSHQLKFIFLNLFGLVMNNYVHCYELV